MITLESWEGSASAIRSYGKEKLEKELHVAFENVKRARREKRLGFMDLPEYEVDEIIAWAEEKRKGITDVVVIGIGGSSLGALAVLASEPPRDSYPTVHFSENMDPDSFNQLVERVELKSTLVIVISKSGTTVETMSKFAILWKKLEEVHGDEVTKYLVAITDPEKGALRALVQQYQLDSFPVPDNVGGRFSVLTPVGLVPLALQGYPIKRLLAGAGMTRDIGLEAATTLHEEGDKLFSENPVAQAAIDFYLLSERGVTLSVLFTYSDALYPLTNWFCQLWGESLGKKREVDGKTYHCGLTPIGALGVVDQHSQLQLYIEGPEDKFIVFLEVGEFNSRAKVPAIDGFPESLSHLVGKDLGEIMKAELDGTESALNQVGRATSRITIDRITPEAVGGFIMFWELLTAVMGELLEINAFDQPGVEIGKKIAHGLLGRRGFEEYVGSAEKKGAKGSVIQK